MGADLAYSGRASASDDLDRASVSLNRFSASNRWSFPKCADPSRVAGDADVLQDFQLISGDPTLSTYNDTDPNQQVGACSVPVERILISPGRRSSTSAYSVRRLPSPRSKLTRPAADGTEDTTPGLPEKDCKAGLRGDITFPSCGQKGIAQAKDHKSHLTWPVDADGKISVKGGDCPDTHPDRYATLVYQVCWGAQLAGRH
jgi:hypothetical protein